MRRDPRVPLADIERAGAEIERFTEGMNGDAYAADTRLDIAAAVDVYSSFVLYFAAEAPRPDSDGAGRLGTRPADGAGLVSRRVS